jgi:methionyl-tRNA formyltransferase
MKILFLTNRDLASNYALNWLLPELSNTNEVHLWLSAKVGKTSSPPQSLKSVKFFEQDLFNEVLSPLISASKKANVYKTFDGLRCFLSSDIKEVNQINSPATIDDLHTLLPDLIVSIRYGGILKASAINVPRLGVINLHSGILPVYKGVMATFWALKNNESEIGTTLHMIEDGTIDTGKIVKISKMKVDPHQSYLEHVLALYKQGSVDILDAIERLASDGVLELVKQDESDSYFTFPSEKECIEFTEKGFVFVDQQAYLAFIQNNYL